MNILNFKTALVALSLAAVSITSCGKIDFLDQKDHDGKGNHHATTIKTPTAVTINQTLAFDEVYTLDLTQYENEKSVSTITKQAELFTTSAITGSKPNSDTKYTYMLDAAKRVAPVAIGDSVVQQVIITVAEPTSTTCSGNGSNSNGGNCGGSSSEGINGGNCNTNSSTYKHGAIITINFVIK